MLATGMGREADAARGEPAEAQGEVAQVADLEVLVDLQGPRGDVEEAVQAQRVGERPRAEHLADHRPEELLLAGDPVEVAVRELLALPHEGERLVALDHLAPCGQVDARVLLLGRPGQADLDAAELVDHALEPLEVDLQVVVDADLGEVLDRVDEQGRVAELEGPVELAHLAGTTLPSTGFTWLGIST